MKRLTNEEFQEVQNRLSKIVNHRGSKPPFNLVLTKQENLIAVPVLVRFWFTEKILNGFIKAAQNYKYSEIVSTWVGVNSKENAFRVSVPPTVEGVSDLRHCSELTMLDTATFSGSPDWVFIHSAISVENYDIIVGTGDIIRLFTNESIEKSFNRFATEVNQSGLQMDFYGNLQVVYEKLLVYNDSSPGTEVVID